MSYITKKRGKNEFLSMKRTSKHNKKLEVRGGGRHRVEPGLPVPGIRDTPVGCVDAENLALHGSNLEERGERRERGKGGSTRVKRTLPAETGLRLCAEGASIGQDDSGRKCFVVEGKGAVCNTELLY